MHEENANYDYYYSRYTQIVTGHESAVDELNSYYSENISAENETIYEILGKYFEEEDIKRIEELHSDVDDTTMYKLYACFRESDFPTEEEKTAVSSLILEGNTILESMNALMHYKNKIETGV